VAQTIVFSAVCELFVPDSGHTAENGEAHLLALGRALRQLREQRRMSPAELAGAAGVERGRIDALEAGRLDPGYELLLALAGALGVEPSALVLLAERLSRSAEP
jgi:HTH-type transcriptional regulator, competence development regulator